MTRTVTRDDLHHSSPATTSTAPSSPVAASTEDRLADAPQRRAVPAPLPAPAHSPPAKTAAQRQRAYRLRRKHAVTQAIGEEDQASRVTLLALLGNCLADLDDNAARRSHDASRHAARRVLRCLVTRYAIDLADEP